VIQDRARRTHAAILTAAREVFAEVGYDGARIDDIAARAKANKQRIYAYFTDKQGLFAAVQAEAIAALASYEEAIIERLEQDPTQLAPLLQDAYLRFHRQHPEFWRLLAWANLSPGAAAAAGNRTRRAVLERLRAVHRRAQKAGAVLAGHSFDAWFVSLTAVIYFLFANQRTASANLGLRLETPGHIERFAGECLSLLSGRPAR